MAAVRIWNILRQFAVSNLLFYNSEISSNFSTKFKLSSIETFSFDNAVLLFFVHGQPFFIHFERYHIKVDFLKISTNPPWRTRQGHVSNSFDVPLRSLLGIYFLMSWFDQTPAQSARSFVPDKTFPHFHLVAPIYTISLSLWVSVLPHLWVYVSYGMVQGHQT